MKINQIEIAKILVLFSFCILIQGCQQEGCQGVRTYIAYTPIYKSIEDIRSEVGIQSPRELCNPGKMFLYGDYIYVNDIRQGIHIIDNANPSSPISIAFINIPGNVDLAVKDNILYADNFTDLEFFDISTPQDPVYKGRLEDVFESNTLNPVLGQLIGFDEEEVTEEYDCDNEWRNHAEFDFNSFDPSLSSLPSGVFTAPSAPQAIAGSLSRFANYGDFLYVIDDQTRLNIFDISDRLNPSISSEIEVGRGIETLFPSGDNLFIGAEDGLFIYALQDPISPTFSSKFEHARACDPVFVQDNTAYVTLRSGTECQGFNNQLDVLDVTNISNPQLLTTVALDNPHGLSLSEDLLFICEGEFGFKIFDKSNLFNISNNELSHIDSFTAFDVIILPGTTTAMVIGQDGLFQFDFSDTNNPVELSLIPATRDCLN